MKKQKGITLIALIITIVVLLILAVVAISAVKENGIIRHAQKAATDYNGAKADEESTIDGYQALIESKLPGGNGESKVTYTDEGIPVPAGFKVVAGTKNMGLVIENETEGSQFVWVPVTTDINLDGWKKGSAETEYYGEPDVITGVIPSEKVDSASGKTCDAVSENLTKAGCTQDLNGNGKINAYDFKIQLIKEYKTMATSVNKYKGFYVGRYETSKNGENPQSKASSEENEVTTACNDSTETDWYTLYKLNKKYNTKSVQGSMIWGVLYDSMMTWMGEEAYSFDSANRNTDERRRCGYVSTDIIKNVYDLGGNCLEWTLETYGGGYRIMRGDYFGTNHSDDGFWNAEWTPASRHISTPEVHSTGSRLALYIVDDEQIDYETNVEEVEPPTIENTDPTIPTGFKYVEGTVNTGYVIENETEGSQFVWVPVSDINSMVMCQTCGSSSYKLDKETAKCTKCLERTVLVGRLYSDPLDRTSFLKYNDSGADYDAMARSTAKYKGFYIGRYETSKSSSGVAQSKKSTEANVIVSADASSEGNWNGLKSLCGTYSTSSVQGKMIWGSQYDQMIAWLGEAAGLSSGYNTSSNPGKVDTDVIKNIYDLYGNKYEGTQELANGTGNPINRSGDNASGNRGLSARCSNWSSTGSYADLGARMIIYITV